MVLNDVRQLQTVSDFDWMVVVVDCPFQSLLTEK